MAQPTIKDVRPVDPVLTNLSISFKNKRFLWDQIAPMSKVDQMSGTYMIYTKDFWFRKATGGERGEDGTYTRVGYGVSNDTYKTIERGFEKVLGDPTKAASQTPENLEMVDLQYLTNLMQLELEKDVAAELFVTGKWTGEETLAGGNIWSDYAASDPINKIDAAKTSVRRATGQEPNHGFIGHDGWTTIKEHPLILQKYMHTQTAIMTPELVAAALGIPQLVVGDSVENTAAEGQTFVGADIWTDNLLLSIKDNPGLGVAAGALTLMWPEGGNGAVPWAVQEYRDDTIRAMVQRVFSHYVPKITAADSGYLFINLKA